MSGVGIPRGGIPIGGYGPRGPSMPGGGGGNPGGKRGKPGRIGPSIPIGGRPPKNGGRIGGPSRFIGFMWPPNSDGMLSRRSGPIPRGPSRFMSIGGGGSMPIGPRPMGLGGFMPDCILL